MACTCFVFSVIYSDSIVTIDVFKLYMQYSFVYINIARLKHYIDFTWEERFISMYHGFNFSIACLCLVVCIRKQQEKTFANLAKKPQPQRKINTKPIDWAQDEPDWLISPAEVEETMLQQHAIHVMQAGYISGISGHWGTECMCHSRSIKMCHDWSMFNHAVHGFKRSCADPSKYTYVIDNRTDPR